MVRQILHRRAFLAVCLLAAVGAGCQEQQTIPLAGGDAGDPQSLAARFLLVDPCHDVPGKAANSRDLVRAVNAERAKAKLPPLRINDTLSQAAEFYACRMIDGEFFGHVDPFDGSTLDSRASNFGYAFLKVGENLAAGQDSVEQVLVEWMNSPGHRANILDPNFTEIGVGVKIGGRMGRCWVQEFGRPVTAGEEIAVSSIEAAVEASSKSALTSQPKNGPTGQ